MRQHLTKSSPAPLRRRIAGSVRPLQVLRDVWSLDRSARFGPNRALAQDRWWP